MLRLRPTFTSHFYGARRTVGYVPFNSESLVTGKLFEDIREATFRLADPALYDAIVVINLCVPTASGVPLQLLPRQINGVRIIGIDVPGFGVPTHAEAKDVLAGAMLRYARAEVEAGSGAAPRAPLGARPTVTLLGEMFPPTRWHRHAARADGPRGRAGGADARVARALCRARRRSSPRSIRSTPPACASSRPPAPDRRLGPGRASTARGWLQAIGEAAGVPQAQASTPPTASCSRRSAARSPHADRGASR